MEQSTKYQNKYRVPSTRLKNWDYAGEGMYFVTLCAKNRENYFGKIEQDKMQLSPAGEIVQKYWMEIPAHFPCVRLDEFIVMPNHIHGIIGINKNDVRDCRDEAMPRLYNANYAYNGEHPQMSQISPKPNSLSVIIGSFKSICAKQIRKLYIPNFAWQPRFYDHIIRGDDSWVQIRQYIQDNPLKWDVDRNNPKNEEKMNIKIRGTYTVS